MTEGGKNSNILIDISIVDGPWPDEEAIRHLTEISINAAHQIDGSEFQQPMEVSLVFTNDKQVRALNAQWRNIDKPTNVLSFEQQGFDSNNENLSQRPIMLGDIVLAGETIMREAQQSDIRLEDYICHMIIHGFLHLLGYDHENDEDAEVMEALEVKALAVLDIANPYQT